MSLGLRCAAVLACLLAWAAPARGADWAATYAGQCCYATLESGEVLGGQYFEFRNTGSQTWTSPQVRLGTSNPRERASAFTYSTWLAERRPAPLAEQAVAPGQTGHFNFTVQAPQVAVTQTFRESFEPLNENVAWLGAPVFLDYTVLPPLPPNVAMTSVPAQASSGAAFDVAAEATDNHAVRRVDFSIGDRTVSDDAPDADGRTYRATLTAPAAGPQTVTARAVDRAGNFAVATANLTVTPAADADGDGSPAGPDCDDTRADVHPGARDVPGDGVDENCDGRTTPGRINALIRSSWVAGRRTRISVLRVVGAPRATTIRLSCHGGGCPFARRSVMLPKGGTAGLSGRFHGSRLRPGAVVEVRVLAPDRISKVARFTMRAHELPRSQYYCLAPGGTKRRSCT